MYKTKKQSVGEKKKKCFCRFCWARPTCMKSWCTLRKGRDRMGGEMKVALELSPTTRFGWWPLWVIFACFSAADRGMSLPNHPVIVKSPAMGFVCTGFASRARCGGSGGVDREEGYSSSWNRSCACACAVSSFLFFLFYACVRRQKTQKWRTRYPERRDARAPGEQRSVNCVPFRFFFFFFFPHVCGFFFSAHPTFEAFLRNHDVLMRRK